MVYADFVRILAARRNGIAGGEKGAKKAGQGVPR
jgi:hypothetical protein